MQVEHQEQGDGASKSTVSEQFVQAFLQRPITARMLVVFVDAICLGPHAILVALGVDEEGHKHVLALREGATEKATVTAALLEDPAAHGSQTLHGLLFVIDGAKAIAAAVAKVFGERVVVHRCTRATVRCTACA